MKFKIQLQTTSNALPWEYEYDMASFPMGIDYAKRAVAHQFANVSWFMSAMIWIEKDGEWNPVARVTIDPAPAKLEIL